MQYDIPLGTKPFSGAISPRKGLRHLSTAAQHFRATHQVVAVLAPVAWLQAERGANNNDIGLCDAVH